MIMGEVKPRDPLSLVNFNILINQLLQTPPQECAATFNTWSLFLATAVILLSM